ncbi:ASCH/PUA domain-containing protein [Enterococcus hirae]|uniref:ASCH/PUA domain-containing protein n=1 Tax=Enterococcus hirae TaxID=1354 RepID=UPI0034598977
MMGFKKGDKVVTKIGSGVSLYFLDNEYYIVQDASMPGRIVLIDDDKQRLSWPSSKFELYEGGNGMKIHELKILPEYFETVTSGRKRFEIRKNDRDYKVGDLLYLREWNGENFTGDSYKAEVTYITDYAQKDGYVVMGIKGLEEENEIRNSTK